MCVHTHTPRHPRVQLNFPSRCGTLLRNTAMTSSGTNNEHADVRVAQMDTTSPGDGSSSVVGGHSDAHTSASHVRCPRRAQGIVHARHCSSRKRRLDGEGPRKSAPLTAACEAAMKTTRVQRRLENLRVCTPKGGDDAATPLAFRRPRGRAPHDNAGKEMKWDAAVGLWRSRTVPTEVRVPGTTRRA